MDTLPGALPFEFPFSFGAYDSAQRAFVPLARIGNPARIFSVTCSAILVESGEALLAWCEDRGRKVEKMKLRDGSDADVVSSTAQVVLSRWQIGTHKVGHVALRQTMNGNISMSLERLDNRVLVAWHDGIGNFGAKVYTQLVDPKTAEFHATPSLALPSTFLDDMKSAGGNAK